MKVPDWRKARDAQAARVKSGYTSVRLTRATLQRLRELHAQYPALGLETLINGLLDLELEQQAAACNSRRRNLHASDASEPE